VAAANEIAREIADNTSPVSVALARRLLWGMLGAEHRWRPTAPTRARCSPVASPPTRARAVLSFSRSARRSSRQDQRRLADVTPWRNASEFG